MLLGLASSNYQMTVDFKSFRQVFDHGASLLFVNSEIAVDFNFLVFDDLVLLDLLLLFINIHQRKHFTLLSFSFVK